MPGAIELVVERKAACPADESQDLARRRPQRDERRLPGADAFDLCAPDAPIDRLLAEGLQLGSIVVYTCKPPSYVALLPNCVSSSCVT